MVKRVHLSSYVQDECHNNYYKIARETTYFHPLLLKRVAQFFKVTLLFHQRERYGVRKT